MGKLQKRLTARRHFFCASQFVFRIIIPKVYEYGFLR